MAIMRAFWIVLSVLLLAAMIVWVRAGATFSLVHTLPLLGGKPPSLCWDGAALAMILIAICGVQRMRRRK
jgi:hypothetical protein